MLEEEVYESHENRSADRRSKKGLAPGKRSAKYSSKKPEHALACRWLSVCSDSVGSRLAYTADKDVR